MYIKRLSLENFRNYDRLDVTFEPGVNMILGENAQGKTNLIEAVYMTGFAKSFRASKDTEVIRFKENRASVTADICGMDFDFTISISITSEGKFVVCDGKKITKMADLLTKVYVVVFSPEDLRLVKDVPEKRRKFIDQELSKLKPSYYDALYNYRRVLKQRNTYLKEENVRTDILDIWNSEAARYGKDIVNKRYEFIATLEQISREIHSSITSGKEELSLEYEPSIGKDDDFYEVMHNNEEKDIRNRTTGRGPHRDDMKICINGIDIRHYGSQGQQRTAALSLKLAEIRLIREVTGENAILLLDDVLSELDAGRQTYLMKSLEDVQMFITSADISQEVADKLAGERIYTVKAGKVE